MHKARVLIFSVGVGGRGQMPPLFGGGGGGGGGGALPPCFTFTRKLLVKNPTDMKYERRLFCACSIMPPTLITFLHPHKILKLYVI